MEEIMMLMPESLADIENEIRKRDFIKFTLVQPFWGRLS